jgi:hypothetical protein
LGAVVHFRGPEEGVVSTGCAVHRGYSS